MSFAGAGDLELREEGLQFAISFIVPSFDLDLLTKQRSQVDGAPVLGIFQI
jgi:hypothetical protein